MGIAMVQVTLGISTLIYLVPTPLAAAHQAGALALLSAAAYLGAQLKRPRVPFQNIVSRLHNASVVKNGFEEVAKNQYKRKTTKLPGSL
jgi:cytochrome c oxidase assembly protein subunit 15